METPTPALWRGVRIAATILIAPSPLAVAYTLFVFMLGPIPQDDGQANRHVYASLGLLVATLPLIVFGWGRWGSPRSRALASVFALLTVVGALVSFWTIAWR
jgi:hypothetical protein